MYQVKIVSSLEKAFLDSDIRTFEPLTSIRMMKNQRLSFQLFFTLDAKDDPYRTMPALTVEGAFSACTTVRTVELEPVVYPAPAEVLAVDANYLRDEPGLYPDWLRPMHYGGAVSVLRGQLHAVWICLDPRDTVAAGVYPVTVSLKGGDEVLASATLTVEVLDADLPEQTMKVTQWFHCDCLANYYDCEPWSERHWRIVENFARTAVENGINLLLTPLFTPPLDTAVGGERTTVQLLDVTVTNGAYSFCFDKLDRWIDMCDRVGVRFFEISHLFTQWGAGHAPKVMATVDGEYRRIFGWVYPLPAHDASCVPRAYESTGRRHPLPVPYFGRALRGTAGAVQPLQGCGRRPAGRVHHHGRAVQLRFLRARRCYDADPLQ